MKIFIVTVAIVVLVLLYSLFPRNTIPETPSFEKDIKPLFRRYDIDSMKSIIKLDDYNDVKKHADHILKRLETGDMPCDGAWGSYKVGLFRKWVERKNP